ncbi:phosphonoacetaldehyde hydrolase [Nisaea acidiphila]|uniref:Phosphonoacetaldehyde hydrolase n=1 Tax=Nisaea acidiphila TaxID=1862145 RepID=A0A9J7AMC2_9PROT|nr:phosphonoacetaldehyde hydrolase [Nisaea acidiphila]UUX48608.1 phosphonoacetaldehyde hydrolase [Nisaea acidiphila]
MSAEELGVKAVIFDWAGTIIDHGSRAPMGVFQRAFAAFDVEITIDEARAPMGLPKWDHIKAVGTQERIAQVWATTHGAPFSDADVDRIYEVFVPMNVDVIPDFADMIPGALDTVAALRGRGLKIGSTTGYNREIMEKLVPIAKDLGYAPDNLVCAGDLAHGRPTPLMMYKCFLDLDVWPAAACIKVDDTEPGIAEGNAAGCWTVGVTVSGNAFGLSREETEALGEADFLERKKKAEQTLRSANPHYLIDSVAALLDVVDDIGTRLAKGERP